MTEARKVPQIAGSVGLTWRPRAHGRWECRWQAHAYLVDRGWKPSTIKMWIGTEDELTPTIRQYLVDRSRAYQTELLAWSRGGTPDVAVATVGEVKTWNELCDAYLTDKDSKFHRLRFKTRAYYKVLINKIRKAVFNPETGQLLGDTLISDVKGRHILRLHERWLDNPDGPPMVTAASSGITMLRILSSFGATMLESDACKAVAYTLSEMTFQGPKPRESFLDLSQIIGIRKAAHELGMPSLALAQAIQWECILRQRDVIGEWVPHSEQTPLTDVMDGNQKWLRGIRWDEIDEHMVLRHITSKRQKMVTISLLDAEMVVEELVNIYGTAERAKLPATGPVIVAEKFGVPWLEQNFRLAWRKCANMAGVPKGTRNMDTRSGAITEATEAGAHIEHVKHAAGHSQSSTTERYARNQEKKGSNVLNIRVASRNKSGT